MAETNIEWTHSNWNPVGSCSIICAGCRHRHAMDMARRLEAMKIAKHDGFSRRSRKGTVWTGVIRGTRLLGHPAELEEALQDFRQLDGHSFGGGVEGGAYVGVRDLLSEFDRITAART